MNILFITSGSIGDAIISTGLLGYLLDTYPQARFTIAVGPAAAPLFEAFPNLKRLIIVRKKPYNLHWLELLRQTIGTHWDWVIDLRGSLNSYLVRTRNRRIFRHPDKTLPKPEQLAALFGLSPAPLTCLWSNAASREKADALLPSGKSIIVLAPKTNSYVKDWPIERFAELAKHLSDDNTVFAVLGSETQRQSIQPLITALPAPQMLDLCGKTNLLTAFAIMERSALFIGNDSGLFHMAAAAKAPCIGIYGPSNDKTYAPRGPHVTIVKAREFAPGEPEIRGNDSYIRQISVERVLEAAKAAIAAPLPAPHR